MSTKTQPVSVAFICDDGYVMPTCVAIQSLIGSKRSDTVYEIYIVCASLTEENEAIFLRFQSPTVGIHILRESAERFASLHVFQEGAACVATPAALLKFILPELLTQLDKVLYLDGDLLVREDLTGLFAADLGDHYLAAVEDSGTLYYRSEAAKQVTHYFNSGVMLLNLAQMRRDDLPQVLIREKQRSTDANLMDQNVFNTVCNGRVLTLPVRYNFLPVNLVRAMDSWNLAQINERYGTAYPDLPALFGDAAVLHFSSKNKPWKDPSVVFADAWYRCYLSAPIDHPLVRGTRTQGPKVSVLLPQGGEEALKEMTASLQNQTLSGIEILREGTPSGEYVYCPQVPVALQPDALQRCWESACWNGLDLLLFEEETGYRKGQIYPGILSGEDLLPRLVRSGDVPPSACFALVKRSLWEEHKADCVVSLLFSAGKAMALNESPVRCLEAAEPDPQAQIQQVLSRLAGRKPEDEALWAAAAWISQQLEGRELSLEASALAPILAIAGYCLDHTEGQEVRRLKEENRSLLQQKKQRWEELQTLYKEKGERWNELQALRKEKAALQKEVKELRDQLSRRPAEQTASNSPLAALKQAFKSKK